MADDPQPETLTELLATLEEVGNGNARISVRHIREHLGARSFGPFLLAIGLIGSTPASGIPGFPTIIGITVLLTAGQLVIGRQQIWLPGSLLRRSLDRERFRKGPPLAQASGGVCRQGCPPANVLANAPARLALDGALLLRNRFHKAAARTDSGNQRKSRLR